MFYHVSPVTKQLTLAATTVINFLLPSEIYGVTLNYQAEATICLPVYQIRFLTFHALKGTVIKQSSWGAALHSHSSSHTRTKLSSDLCLFVIFSTINLSITF